RSWLSLIPSFSLAALTWAFSSLLRYIRACGKLICFSSQSTIANNIIAQRLSTVNKLSPPRLLHATGRRRRGALAPVIKLPSKLQERLLLFGVRGVRYPGLIPIDVLQDSRDRTSPALLGASYSHRRAVGGEENLVFLWRPDVLIATQPPEPD